MPIHRDCDMQANGRRDGLISNLEAFTYDVDDGSARPLHRPDRERSSRTIAGNDAMQTPRTVGPACKTTSNGRPVAPGPLR
jgi:hypothetical protein